MNRYFKSKIAAIFSLIMAMLLTVTGCGVKQTAGQQTGDASTSAGVDLGKVTLRVGDSGWGFIQAALKASGLNDTPYKVEYSNFASGNLGLQAMAADQIDFMNTSETPPIFAAAAENGGNFKVIAVSNGNTLQQELVAGKDTGIKTAADLKGKTVGYVTATTAHYFLLKMLQNAGLAWSDIKAEKLTPADGTTALAGGKIDAFASFGNSITAAYANGATLIESAKDILSGNFPYEATPAALADPGKRAAIVDFLARIEKAHQWKRSNPEAWAKVSAKPSGLTYEEALKLFKDGEAQRPSTVIPVSDKTIASEQDISDVFLAVGLLKEKQDVREFHSDAITEELIEALNK